MADQGFPRRGWGGAGANPCVWPKNLLFGKIFVKNCMKVKEIGPGGGGRVSSDPIISANGFRF